MAPVSWAGTLMGFKQGSAESNERPFTSSRAHVLNLCTVHASKLPIVRNIMDTMQAVSGVQVLCQVPSRVRRTIREQCCCKGRDGQKIKAKGSLWNTLGISCQLFGCVYHLISSRSLNFYWLLTMYRSSTKNRTIVRDIRQQALTIFNKHHCLCKCN